MRVLETWRWGWLVLAVSASTLVCCALPILLVSLGLGAVSAALFANLPFLSVMAANKLWLFLASGILIAAAGWLLFRPGRTCPADPELAARCRKAERWNRRLLCVACGLWFAGFASAYLALPMLRLLES